MHFWQIAAELFIRFSWAAFHGVFSDYLKENPVIVPFLSHLRKSVKALQGTSNLMVMVGSNEEDGDS